MEMENRYRDEVGWGRGGCREWGGVEVRCRVRCTHTHTHTHTQFSLATVEFEGG